MHLLYIHMPVCVCVYVCALREGPHSRWIALNRGPKEGEEPEPKSGEFLLFSRPGDACTVILWMKSASEETEDEIQGLY